MFKKLIKISIYTLSILFVLPIISIFLNNKEKVASADVPINTQTQVPTYEPTAEYYSVAGGDGGSCDGGGADGGGGCDGY